MMRHRFGDHGFRFDFDFDLGSLFKLYFFSIRVDQTVRNTDLPIEAKKEAKVLTVSLNSFNVLNHPNYVTYIGTQSSPLFGQPVAALPPRRMQLDVQFKF